MNVLVIVAHPNKASFNHAIARTAAERLERNGHSVAFHDLYQENFDPILPYEEIPQNGVVPPEIDRHCKALSCADGIVIVHPNWWGQPPAILKGWIDRVIRPGIAYNFQEGDQGEGVPVGLLRAKAALVFNTSNTPQLREQTVFDDPLESLWKTCIFELCGVKRFYRKMFCVVVTSTPEQRKAWLQEVEDVVNDYFPA